MTAFKKIHLVMAARPNIMKVAPLYHALKKVSWAKPVLVHTGQHYDDSMSKNFLRDFDLPEPDFSLNIGSGTYAEQAGKTMIAYEKLCYDDRPDLSIVVGDVNATLACAFAAKKLEIEIGHMEAGLRSFDRSMPEEINRIATDSISDLFWTPSSDATQQLLKENIPQHKISQVGNIMIDAYCMVEEKVKTATTRHDFGLEAKHYAVVTFHRPSNVDSPDNLAKVVTCLVQLADRLPVVFPVHPRTLSKLKAAGLMPVLEQHPHVKLTLPLSYIAFMNLVMQAKCVVTDSGAVQEETTYLGVPCLTLRQSTERPITVTNGTNKLVDFTTVLSAVQALTPMPRPVLEGWDGQAAQRTVAHLEEVLF